MRISDWSSDVCSSDLPHRVLRAIRPDVSRVRRMTSSNITPDAAQVETTASIPRAVLTVFLPFAGGYYLSYLYRSVNAIIAEPLVRDIGLAAADLGLLTADYLLAFALPTVPLGVLPR